MLRGLRLAIPQADAGEPAATARYMDRPIALLHSRDSLAERICESTSASETPKSVAADPFPAPSPKRLRSSIGHLHDNNLCVWCMRPEDKKHPGRKLNTLYLINQEKAWNVFKQHTVLLDDMDMRSHSQTG